MPAQNGDSVSLVYSAGYPRQQGDAVLLSYSPPVSDTAIRLRAGTRGPWVAPAATITPTQSPSVATGTYNPTRRLPWVAPKPLGAFAGIWWPIASHRDQAIRSPWGSYPSHLASVDTSPWVSPVFKDVSYLSLWGKFNYRLESHSTDGWVSSVPKDKGSFDPWRGFLIPSYTIAGIYRPHGSSVFFNVVGGDSPSLNILTLVQSIARDNQFIDAAIDPTPYVPHFSGDHYRSYDIKYGGADFTVGLGTVVLDDTVLIRSNVDPSGLYPWGAGKKLQLEEYAPWTRFSRTLNPGWNAVTPPGGPSTDPHGTIIVPTRSVYIVMNNVTLIRVSDGMELPVLTASVSIDVDTWAWGFSASLPGYCFEEVLPPGLLSPVELDLTFNGTTYRVLTEKVSRDRSFGKSSVAISGRGTTAYLADPYSEISTFSAGSQTTSQQLVDSVLTTNGVPLGWTVSWEVPVWNIAPDIWTKRGTYIEAVTDITSSIGAYILPDPYLKAFSVKSKYPIMPWDWASATPDIVLPSSVVTKEGVEWIEKPDYNGVYVSGTIAGVVAHVRKSGTIGDKLAPSVFNSLILATEPARELGRSILGYTGRMATVTLSVPLLEELGVIPVGALVKYTDAGVTMIGMVRSLSMSSNNDAVRQVIEVEVHG